MLRRSGFGGGEGQNGTRPAGLGGARRAGSLHGVEGPSSLDDGAGQLLDWGRRGGRLQVEWRGVNRGGSRITSEVAVAVIKARIAIAHARRVIATCAQQGDKAAHSHQTEPATHERNSF